MMAWLGPASRAAVAVACLLAMEICRAAQSVVGVLTFVVLVIDLIDSGRR
jgi:hypothetical protein